MNEENENDIVELQYPLDPFMVKLSLFTDKVFKEWMEKGVFFEIEGEVLNQPNETIMLSKPEMLLPLILADADSTHREMISGSKLPFYLYKENGGLLDYCPAVHDYMETNTMSLWTHHIDYSIEKIIEKNEPNYKKKLGKEKIKVSLDEVHENFKSALENNKLEIRNYPTYATPDVSHRSIF